MDSQKLKELVKELNKKLTSWDWQKAVNNSVNETTTREFLIHPFLDLLNYDRIDDYTHEVTADLRDKQGKKVDVAITLGGKTPIILIECKKASQKLNDNHYRQLREYCNDIPSSKIGIRLPGNHLPCFDGLRSTTYEMRSERTPEKLSMVLPFAAAP